MGHCHKQLHRVLSWGFLLIWFALPGLAVAANLLNNGGFETFQSYKGKVWKGYSEEYGTGWTLTTIEKAGLHFLNSDTFGQLLATNYGVPYFNYKLEGNYSQAFASRNPYNIVFKQAAPVTSGQDYAFAGQIATFWKGTGGEVDNGKIFKRVGIDPTGGTNPANPEVIWTDWDGTDNNWVSLAVAAKAQSGQATAFVQVINIADDVGSQFLNAGYLDSFRFERAPVAQLNLPAQAPPGPVNVTWSSTIPDPGFWSLWGYDVELKDNLSSNWQTIQSHQASNGKNSNHTFNGQAGRTYTMRVRPWQQVAPNGNPAIPGLPGIWKEANITIGQAVAGTVFDHVEQLLSGVTVSISGTTTSTLSAFNGEYALPTGSTGSFEVVANNFNNLAAPPSTAVSVPTNLDVGRLTITMRPTGGNQAIRNNDFETDLTFWSASEALAVQASTAEFHTGKRSLHLSQTVNISQTRTVANITPPVLSFWYKTDKPFTVQFLGSTNGALPLTPLLTKTLNPVSSWQHAFLHLAGNKPYNGPIGVNFSYTGAAGANIFIDEVSIGPGPYKTYLPVVEAELGLP